jgi:hypothetical protein
MAKKFLTGIDVSNQKVLNLADGTAATDAVTLQQLQAAIRGLSWKQSVRAASTTNVNTAAPGASIDGYTLVANDRILLKDQTTPAQNGIYVWTGAASALTRSTDADSSAELLGATVYVESGTVNGDRMYTQTQDTIATLGTSTISFAQLGGGGTTYSAGNGLSLAGTTFHVVPGTGILADGTSTRVDFSVAVRKYSADVPSGATTVAITHNLGTTDITYKLRLKATGEIVETDATVTDANTLTLTFATAPTTGQYRVAVHA